jgi:hypothetical protein
MTLEALVLMALVVGTVLGFAISACYGSAS